MVIPFFRRRSTAACALAVSAALVGAPSAFAQTAERVVAVPAREQWVDTGVDVVPGEQLKLTATGVWFDFYIPCSADGYPAGLFYDTGHKPRILDHRRFFRLMGRVGDPEHHPGPDTQLDAPPADATFRIGTAATYTALRTGRLYVFANDEVTRYGNNWGEVQLQIQVLSQPDTEHQQP